LRFRKQNYDQLNNTPRKCLGWKTPAEMFQEKLVEEMEQRPHPQQQYERGFGIAHTN
jgi:IS30 family transposase